MILNTDGSLEYVVYVEYVEIESPDQNRVSVVFFMVDIE